MNAPESPPVLGQNSNLIKFSFSLVDLIKCRLWVAYHHRLLMGIKLFFCCLFPLVDLNTPKIAQGSLGLKIFVFLSMATIMFCFISLIEIVLQILLACSAKNRGLVGKHELVICDDSLVEKTEFNESAHRWSGFHMLRSSRNYFFLYVTDNIVHYVPKRCFSSTQEAKQFEALILKNANKS